MVQLYEIEDVREEVNLETYFIQPVINVQCKECNQTFGIFGNFRHFVYYRGTNYFLVEREHIDWDIRIIEQTINFWCACGSHLGIHWDQDILMFKKSAIKLQV